MGTVARGEDIVTARKELSRDIKALMLNIRKLMWAIRCTPETWTGLPKIEAEIAALKAEHKC